MLIEKSEREREREKQWSVLAGECRGGTALPFPSDSLLSACLFSSRSKRIWVERAFSQTEGINSSELQPLGICLVCQLKAAKLSVPRHNSKFQSCADMKGKRIMYNHLLVHHCRLSLCKPVTFLIHDWLMKLDVA